MGGRNASPERSRVRLVVAAEPDCGARPELGWALYRAVTALGPQDDVDVELVVAVASDEAELAQRLLDAAPKTVSGVRVVEYTVRDPGSPLSPAAAEVAERPSLFTEPGVTVAVSTVTGAARDRRGLRALAALWGVAVLDGDPDEPESAVLIRPPRSACNAVLIGALRFTVLEKHASGDADRVVVASGYEGLVVRTGDGGYRTTRAWHALIADRSLIGLPDFDSACADLLERCGDVTDARLLRDHIRDWNRRRIWDWNYVPEMVLHDEAHSVSVDRLVAALCEPLLSARDGAATPLLKTRDVYVLALAAWLHDWGHGGATISSEFMSDPVDVRRFHGLLTRVRLTDDAQLHGLADEERGAVADEVALYSAHHQGWTSAGRDAVVSPMATVGTKHWQQHVPPIVVKSFDEDYAEHVQKHPPSRRGRMQERPGVGVGAGLRKAHLMLALLRLADAMDMGVHRVPHLDRCDGDAFKRVVDDYVSRAVLAGPNAAAGVLALGETGLKAMRSIVHGTAPLPRTELAAAQALRIAKDSLPTAVQEYLNRGDVPEDASKEDQVLVAVYEYVVTHITKQIVFFTDHDRVRAVVPEWVPTTVNGRDALSLQLHVVPAPAERSRRSRSGPTRKPSREREMAGEAVQELVIRELARNLDGSHVNPSPQREMRDHLEAVGITAWATKTVIAEPGPEPTCRTAGSIGGPAHTHAAAPRPRAMAVPTDAGPPKVPADGGTTGQATTAAARLPAGRLVPVAHGGADATSWVGIRQDGTRVMWSSHSRTRPIADLPAVADLQAVAATDDGWWVAAIAPAGRLTIQSLRDGQQLIRRPVDADAVLALSTVISGHFVLVTRADGSVWLLHVPDVASASVTMSPVPVVGGAVQGAIVASRPVVLAADGRTTPPGFGLEALGSLHRLDIVTRHADVLVACVPRDRPTEVHAWRTGRRGRGQASMPKLVLVTRDPIDEIRWIRDHEAPSAPTVMARCGATWLPSTEQP